MIVAIDNDGLFPLETPTASVLFYNTKTLYTLWILANFQATAGGKYLMYY